MEGFPWGGSEELWYKAALYALEQNQSVCFSSKYWGDETAPKINNLIKKGAKAFFRGQIPQKDAFRTRLIRRTLDVVGIKRPEKLDDWNWIRVNKPDVVCINMGGPYDVIRRNDLMTVLLEDEIPYVLIQQFNFEHHILRDTQRKRARELFYAAQKVFFVAKRNWKVTERTIAKRLLNGVQISNPVNLESTDAVKYPVVVEDYHLAVVARLDVSFKGHDILLELLSMPKWRNLNWKLNLYGEGPDRKYIEELILFYNLNEKVFLHGNKSNIREIWEENHILFLPSYAEGTPLSLIEAMVCARTAIVTNVGGNADLVEDCANGFVANFPNVESLDRAFTIAWEQRENWSLIGAKARKGVIEKINFQSHIELYEAIKSYKN